MLEGIILGLHLMSYHDAGNFNNVNPGIYIKHESGVTVGTYYNSVKRQSYYGGYTFKPIDALPNLDVTVGVVTGYPSMPVAPLFIPSYTFYKSDDGLRARAAFLPRFGDVQPANVIHFMVEKSF